MKFLNVKRQYDEWKDEFDAAYNRVMESGRYIGGKEVEAFEEEWARYCGAKYCVALSSGATSLTLALTASGIMPGEGVIVPSNTYIATWFAVLEVRCIPVVQEPDETYCMNKVRWYKGTKAIIPVHLYGIASNMAALERKAQKHNWTVISDCAQAHGAMFNGKNVGAFDWVNCWSFYPGKNLGAFGDAGAITTNQEDIMLKVKSLRNHGSTVKYENETWGVNGRMDPLQAAFLRIKLPHLDEMNDKRRKIATYYQKELADVPDLVLPVSPSYSHTVWHQFVVRHPKRAALKQWLEVNNVPTMMHYPIAPHQSIAILTSPFAKGKYPLAEEYASTVLSLPIDPFLSDTEVEQVVKAVKTFQ